MVVAVMGAGYLAPPTASRNSTLEGSGGALHCEPQIRWGARGERRSLPSTVTDSNHAKSELTLSELWMRLMASPRSRAIDTCLIFGQALAASESGMVSLTMTSERGES